MILKAGKVLRIINDTTLIIQTNNINVNRGDQLVIVEQSTEIFDDNGKSLGFFNFIKEEIEVVEKHEKYVIAKKIIRGDILTKTLLDNKSFIKFEKMNVEPTQNENLKLSNPKITIGDTVLFKS